MFRRKQKLLSLTYKALCDLSLKPNVLCRALPNMAPDLIQSVFVNNLLLGHNHTQLDVLDLYGYRGRVEHLSERPVWTTKPKPAPILSFMEKSLPNLGRPFHLCPLPSHYADFLPEPKANPSFHRRSFASILSSVWNIVHTLHVWLLLSAQVSAQLLPLTIQSNMVLPYSSIYSPTRSHVACCCFFTAPITPCNYLTHLHIHYLTPLIDCTPPKGHCLYRSLL